MAVRLDPFQNIVNVGWGGGFALLSLVGLNNGGAFLSGGAGEFTLPDGTIVEDEAVYLYRPGGAPVVPPLFVEASEPDIDDAEEAAAVLIAQLSLCQVVVEELQEGAQIDLNAHVYYLDLSGVRAALESSSLRLGFVYGDAGGNWSDMRVIYHEYPASARSEIANIAFSDLLGIGSDVDDYVAAMTLPSGPSFAAEFPATVAGTITGSIPYDQHHSLAWTPSEEGEAFGGFEVSLLDA